MSLLNSRAFPRCNIWAILPRSNAYVLKKRSLAHLCTGATRIGGRRASMPLTMILSDHENSQTSLSLFDGINCPIYDDHEELNLDKLLDYPTGIVFAGTSNCDSIHAQTDSYNAEMRSRMGSDICYHHELGMNYTYILPELIVGSVPQTTDDINHLSEKVGITAILNLQHQCDWEKFGIDFGALQHRCHERGDIRIVRCPIEDFSSASLCKHLPKAVYALQSLLEEGHKVYIHCTAGLGRAPAVAIGHLHWRYSMSLEESYRHVTSRRKCHPKAAAIRQATLALSMGNEGAVNFSWAGNARKVQVTGNFLSWQLPGVQLIGYADNFFMQEMCLPPGLHQYKYVVDEKWVHSEDEPTIEVDGNTNNIVLVRRPANSRQDLSLEKIINQGRNMS